MKQPWPIPEHLIKREKVDYENEALSALGGSVAVGSKLLSKPISIGVMSMLEVMDNKLIKKIFTGSDDIEPESDDLHAVFYLNHYRKDALEDVREWFRGNQKPLEKKISEFAKNNKIHDAHSKYVIDMIMRSNLGFKMIPGKGGGSEMIYGAEAIAGIAFVCSEKLGIDHEKVTWDTPITLIGHVIAMNAIKNGVKNVERPYDLEQMKCFEKTSEECDENEDLYPWQKDNPFKIGMFMWQTKTVLKKWIAAANEYIAQNGETPKKDKTEIARVKGMHPDIRSKYLKELKISQKSQKETNKKTVE
jgi:hypothetical protein